MQLDDGAVPGAWQSQHFCDPDVVKPEWQLVQAVFDGIWWT